jgi:3-oxoacyl-[acyl-carrier protein] reductase
MIKKKINSIILGGSRGIGREIYNELNKISSNVIKCSSKNIDTSNLESVEKFIKKNKTADVLILNTGGPPVKDFYKISEKEWSKYFNQLFLSFTIMLQKIKMNKGGYVFLISSSIIKEPSVGLEISSSLRTGFVSLFKSISLHENNRNISFINIAPGPFKTERVKELVTNMKSFEKNLPTRKIGNPNEIGKFVRFVIENKIKYLTGSTVYFDGNINKSII